MSGRCDLVFKTPAGEDYCAQDRVVWFVTEPTFCDVMPSYQTGTETKEYKGIVIPNKRSDDLIRCSTGEIPVYVVDSYSSENSPLVVTDQTLFRCVPSDRLTNWSDMFRKVKVFLAGMEPSTFSPNKAE